MLHVDDEAEELKFAKLFLEEADPSIHVDSISSPSEALYMLRQQSYDCVISDYSMPELDGVEFCRRTHEILSVPFIMYTGRGSDEVAAAAFDAGADDYIRKEVDPGHYQVLAERIRIAVEKHRALEASEVSESKHTELVDLLPKAVVEADEMGNLSHSKAKVLESLRAKTPRLGDYKIPP